MMIFTKNMHSAQIFHQSRSKYVPCSGLSFFKYENVGSSSILYMFMQMPRKLKSSTDMKSVLVHLGNHGEDDSSGTVRWKASG